MSILFFKKIYVCILERACVHVWGEGRRERETETETEPEAASPLCAEPDAELSLMTHEIVTQPKPRGRHLTD